MCEYIAWMCDPASIGWEARVTSRTITAKPEILTPRRRMGGSAFDDENLDYLSHLLDDFIRIPGTPIRFGLDGIVGFIPGIGDILGGLASMIIIIAAWARGVPKVTLTRMVMNVAIETAVGAVPVLGNLFDIGWRANRRNYKLLTSSLVQPEETARRSWLFFGLVCVVLLAMMIAPVLLLGWMMVHVNALLATH
jgi:Domain of unknown function (DUF4112)